MSTLDIRAAADLLTTVRALTEGVINLHAADAPAVTDRVWALKQQHAPIGVTKPEAKRRLRSLFATQPTVLDLLSALAADTFDASSGDWTLVRDQRRVVETRWAFPVFLLFALHQANLAPTPNDLWRQSPDLALWPDADRDAALAGELADAHVHIGAAVPFPSLLLVAIEAIATPVRTSKANHRLVCVSTSPSVEQPVTFDSQVLLLATKITTRLLWQFVSAGGSGPRGFASWLSSERSAGKLYPELSQALIDGPAFWRTVAEEMGPDATGHVDVAWLADIGTALPGPRGSIQAVAPRPYVIAKDVAARFHASTSLPKVDDPERIVFWLFGQLFAYWREHRDDELFTLHLTQLVRSVCLLHRGISQSFWGGHVFFDYYERQKVLREGAGLTHDADLTREALRHLHAKCGVTRLELRPSMPLKEDGPDGKKVTWRPDQFRGYLRRILNAYETYLNELPRGSTPPAVAFPMSFIRRDDDDRPGEARPAPSGDLTSPVTVARDSSVCSWRFGEIWMRMELLADVLIASPPAARFFGLVDVAGNEHHQANWVFCQLYRELEHRLSYKLREPVRLNYAFHSGEMFVTPLQGLRRMGEVLTWAPQVTRIGHGLAAGWSREGHWHSETLTDQLAHELHDDLVWAWGQIDVSFPGHPLQALLAARIQTLSSSLYDLFSPSAPPSVATFHRAYHRRFEPDALIALGLLAPHERVDTWRSCSGTVTLSSETKPPDPDLILLHHYLTAVDSAPLSPSHVHVPIAGYRDLTEKAYRLLAPVIRRQLVDRGRDGLVIETCPTSNFVISEWKGYEAHPMFRHGAGATALPLTVNSDDPGIFHVSIRDEYAAIWEASATCARLPSIPQRQDWLRVLRERSLREAAPTLKGVTSLPQLKAELQSAKAALEHAGIR